MSKDDKFWLMAGYIIAGLLFTYVLWLMLETIGIQTGWLERYDQWYQPLAIVLSFLGGGGCIFAVRRNKEREEYFLSAIAELRKVSWPSAIDTRKMTIIVCVVVAIFSAILAVFDIVWAKLLKLIIS